MSMMPFNSQVQIMEILKSNLSSKDHLCNYKLLLITASPSSKTQTINNKIMKQEMKSTMKSHHFSNLPIIALKCET